MQKTAPHLHLFFVRCTLMAFHALMWSFLYQSRPEYTSTSLKVMSQATFDKHLNAVVITGAIFLCLIAIFTLVGVSMQSIGMHYLMIIFHALGILLVIISILEYWDVRLLWLPACLTCILPAIIELVFDILRLVRSR